MHQNIQDVMSKLRRVVVKPQAYDVMKKLLVHAAACMKGAQAKIKELSRELRHLQRHLSKRETEVLNLTQELHDREGLGPVVDARTLKSVCPRPRSPPGCSRHRLSVRKQPVWRH